MVWVTTNHTLLTRRKIFANINIVFVNDNGNVDGNVIAETAINGSFWSKLLSSSVYWTFP